MKLDHRSFISRIAQSYMLKNDFQLRLEPVATSAFRLKPVRTGQAGFTFPEHSRVELLRE
jgi:hypothetical protein